MSEFVYFDHQLGKFGLYHNYKELYSKLELVYGKGNIVFGKECQAGGYVAGTACKAHWAIVKNGLRVKNGWVTIWKKKMQSGSVDAYLMGISQTYSWDRASLEADTCSHHLSALYPEVFGTSSQGRIGALEDQVQAMRDEMNLEKDKNQKFRDEMRGHMEAMLGTLAS